MAQLASQMGRKGPMTFEDLYRTSQARVVRKIGEVGDLNLSRSSGCSFGLALADSLSAQCSAFSCLVFW